MADEHDVRKLLLVDHHEYVIAEYVDEPEMISNASACCYGHAPHQEHAMPESVTTLNLAQAADLLGVDPKTLRGWTSQGLIRVHYPHAWSRPWYERKVVEKLAAIFGITLKRSPHHPAHYTPPSLAKAIGNGMTATIIRRMIGECEIRILSLPETAKRQSRMIDQAEGLRVIAAFRQAQAHAEAG